MKILKNAVKRVLEGGPGPCGGAPEQVETREGKYLYSHATKALYSSCNRSNSRKRPQSRIQVDVDAFRSDDREESMLVATVKSGTRKSGGGYKNVSEDRFVIEDDEIDDLIEQARKSVKEFYPYFRKG